MPISAGPRQQGTRSASLRQETNTRKRGMNDLAFGFQAAPASELHKSDQALYREVMEDCALGSKLGFDAAWLLEHHFSDYYPTSSPLLFMAHIAAAFPDLSPGTPGAWCCPGTTPVAARRGDRHAEQHDAGHAPSRHRPRHRPDGIRRLQCRHERGPRALRGVLPHRREGTPGRALHPRRHVLEDRAADLSSGPSRWPRRCASTAPSAVRAAPR